MTTFTIAKRVCGYAIVGSRGFMTSVRKLEASNDLEGKYGEKVFMKLKTLMFGPPKSEPKPSYPRRALTPLGLELIVNAPGFDEKDLKICIEDRVLTVKGEAEDMLGGDMVMDEAIQINEDINFDPENLGAQIRDGQIKVVFPYPVDKTEKKKMGRYPVRWINSDMYSY